TQRLLPVLGRAQSAHPLFDAARGQLQGFAGTMAAGKAAPLIFYAWVRQHSDAALVDEVGDTQWQGARRTRTLRDALNGVLVRDDAWWCDDKTTPAAETCQQQVDAAMTRALDELQARHGSDVATWRWGDAHVARSDHRTFSRVKPLARFFDLRVPVGGD